MRKKLKNWLLKIKEKWFKKLIDNRKMKKAGWKKSKIDYKGVKLSLWDKYQKVTEGGKPMKEFSLNDILPWGVTIVLGDVITERITIGESSYSIRDLDRMGVGIVTIRWGDKESKWVRNSKLLVRVVDLEKQVLEMKEWINNFAEMNDLPKVGLKGGEKDA